MLEVLSAEALLVNMAKDFTPRPPYRPQTKFESRGLRLGHGVWDLVFRRNTDTPRCGGTMRFSAHPFWLVGFRPFFTLACLSGLSLPLLWVLVYLGACRRRQGPSRAVQWHAHEMFFGFGWAVLGGFLLTSTKNWVQIRGYHGAALVFLAAAWLFERAGMGSAALAGLAVRAFQCKLFLGSIVAMLLWTLVRHRKTDSYRDNYFFLLILPAFLVAKHLMLDAGHFQAGIAMATGLFRVAFLVMLERTLTQFMKNVFQVDILRHAALDKAIKLLGLLLVGRRLPAAGAGPPGSRCCWPCCWPAGCCSGSRSWRCAGSTSASCTWAMPPSCCSCCSNSSARSRRWSWVGAVSTHVFGLGVMGLIIPAMLIRIAKGHTGRKVVFDPATRRCCGS
jgi:uncharacterized protein involved in response to NO